MVKTYQAACTAGAQRLSTVLFAGDEKQNLSFRQLLINAVGADATLGSDATVTTGNGLVITAAQKQPVSIGPFETGAVRLSDLWAVGAGATLTILGVPF